MEEGKGIEKVNKEKETEVWRKWGGRWLLECEEKRETVRTCKSKHAATEIMCLLLNQVKSRKTYKFNSLSITARCEEYGAVNCLVISLRIFLPDKLSTTTDRTFKRFQFLFWIVAVNRLNFINLFLGNLDGRCKRVEGIIWFSVWFSHIFK